MKEYKTNRIRLLCREGAAPGGRGAFTEAAATRAMRFHQSVPGYEETRLAALKDAASRCGIRAIYVKDESTRFGLKAFKGLGGSYSMYRILCEKLGVDPENGDFLTFQEEGIRERCGAVTFVTATDGNHGKGVSWAAGLFGCQAYVFMPKGSVEARRRAIEEAGSATAVITELNYDQTVEYASRLAEENGWILIQDTAWDGYETIPRWIIEGYLTMGAEAVRQLGTVRPTHVFLQAGVGAMAGGITGYLLQHYQDDPPKIFIVEPETVACIYQSAEAGDGCIHPVGGDPQTIMAGLNCGTPCSITWPVLRDGATGYLACTDAVSESGMRAYHDPTGGDPEVVSGESGAATYGAVLEVLGDSELRGLCGLGSDSVVLLISTEGDTDPEGYARVVEMKEERYNSTNHSY